MNIDFMPQRLEARADENISYTSFNDSAKAGPLHLFATDAADAVHENTLASENYTPSTETFKTNEQQSSASMTPEKGFCDPSVSQTAQFSKEMYTHFCKARFTELVMADPSMANDQNKMAQILAKEWSTKLEQNHLGGTPISQA